MKSLRARWHGLFFKQKKLLAACAEGDAEAAGFWISQGAVVNCCDSKGLGPLCYAMGLDCSALAIKLVKAGARPLLSIKGSPLLHAAQFGSLDLISSLSDLPKKCWLVGNGYSVAVFCGQDGRFLVRNVSGTPLAALEKRPDGCEAVLRVLEGASWTLQDMHTARQAGLTFYSARWARIEAESDHKELKMPWNGDYNSEFLFQEAFRRRGVKAELAVLSTAAQIVESGKGLVKRL
jgi:hypothetical protein